MGVGEAGGLSNFSFNFSLNFNFPYFSGVQGQEGSGGVVLLDIWQEFGGN